LALEPELADNNHGHEHYGQEGERCDEEASEGAAVNASKQQKTFHRVKVRRIVDMRIEKPEH
jgi:hypothetical protein